MLQALGLLLAEFPMQFVIEFFLYLPQILTTYRHTVLRRDRSVRTERRKKPGVAEAVLPIRHPQVLCGYAIYKPHGAMMSSVYGRLVSRCLPGSMFSVSKCTFLQDLLLFIFEVENLIHPLSSRLIRLFAP